MPVPGITTPDPEESRVFGGGGAQIPWESTGAPTTTTTCQSCRYVYGESSLSGYYTLQKSGDNRCTMDGCLYKKQNTDDVYCFKVGSYNVGNECPP